MLEFKLLFYINLRDANISRKAPKTDEIAMLIHEQLELSESCTVADIRKCLSAPSTLVLMDSLDELMSKRLPRRGLHNKSCMITTSRPWKLEALRSQLDGHIDNQIEIAGLKEESPKELAENVVNILNKEFIQTKNANDFIQKVNSENLQDFLNIPILVLQMLSLWFDGESFGNSQYEIHSKMIHHQILSALKAKDLPEYASKSKREFPVCCNADTCPCKNYGELLWRVAKLAYQTLFSENRETCLVFDHEVTTMHGLSTEDVDICLKIGLFTQHKLFVKKLTVEKKSVRFLHKTNQEYFASIFLSNIDQKSNLQHLSTVIADLDRALELDKFLLFCSDQNAEVSHQLSHLISVIAEEDRRVQGYRQSCDRYAPNTDLIMKIQNIILPATKPNTSTKLILSDIYIDEPYTFHSIDIRGIDMAGVKSIYVDSPIEATRWATLTQSRCLQRLVLFDCGKSGESIQEMIMGYKDTLKALGLYAIRNIELDMSSLGDKLTEILNGNQLTSLGLGHVKLSHAQCQMLVSHFLATDNLSEVRLEHLLCATHGCRGECPCSLDLTHHKRLTQIQLRYLSFKSIVFHANQLRECKTILPDMHVVSNETSYLTCLGNAPKLQILECWNLKDSTSVNELITALPRLDSLRRIKLCEIDFGSLTEICLSTKMEKLESIELSNNVTVTCDGLKCLVNSLPSHRIEIRLVHITIRGRENVLQEFRDSPATEVTRDIDVKYVDGRWSVWSFAFYSNT